MRPKWFAVSLLCITCIAVQADDVANQARIKGLETEREKLTARLTEIDIELAKLKGLNTLFEKPHIAFDDSVIQKRYGQITRRKSFKKEDDKGDTREFVSWIIKASRKIKSSDEFVYWKFRFEDSDEKEILGGYLMFEPVTFGYEKDDVFELQLMLPKNHKEAKRLKIRFPE